MRVVSGDCILKARGVLGVVVPDHSNHVPHLQFGIVSLAVTLATGVVCKLCTDKAGHAIANFSSRPAIKRVPRMAMPSSTFAGTAYQCMLNISSVEQLSVGHTTGRVKIQ